MEPIPETAEAADELNPYDTDDGLLDDLRATSDRVRDVVPRCVGMSLMLHQHGVTLTLVATDAEISALDAVQYLDGGPCARAVEADQVVGVSTDAMSEAGWQLFADATAARGVSSTLSLPLVRDGQVVGGVNLYADTTDAFDGHHETLSEILGAWALGAVTNADLSFSTLVDARRAPQVLRDGAVVDTATGILASRLRLEVTEARRRLISSAADAGLGLVPVARLLIKMLGSSSA